MVESHCGIDNDSSSFSTHTLTQFPGVKKEEDRSEMEPLFALVIDWNQLMSWSQAVTLSSQEGVWVWQMLRKQTSRKRHRLKEREIGRVEFEDHLLQIRYTYWFLIERKCYPALHCSCRRLQFLPVYDCGWMIVFEYASESQWHLRLSKGHGAIQA